MTESKDPDAFRTISEVAAELDLPQHVLRFWETRFSQIRPMKRGGGRRYYRRDDVELLAGIRFLLYSEGYTIKGVQRILKERGARAVITAPEQGIAPMSEAEGEDAVQAVSVKEAQAPASKGLLGRLTGSDAGTGAGGGIGTGAGAGEDGQDRLKAVLRDLLECKRLLDQVR